MKAMLPHRGPVRLPSEMLVHDGLSPCPYRPGQIARMPMRLPLQALQPADLSGRLAVGDRRQGLLLYRPTCPMCHACVPIRLDVGAFKPTRTQTRVFRRGEREIDTKIGRPRLSSDRVALYNRHKVGRGLLTSDGLIRTRDYEEFLVESCAESIELTYYHQGNLIAVAIADRASDALSAVYCYFDPDAGRFSPGTYSILKQVELCRRWGLRYLYLGLYVADCDALRYKTRFRPHQQLRNGVWHDVE